MRAFFRFFISRTLWTLIGLAVPTGIVSFLGLMLSLVAIGRAPRGCAALGVILGGTYVLEMDGLRMIAGAGSVELLEL